MTDKLLNFIKELSLKDKKTLPEKALKTSEESGELAKVVLSYSGAYATKHRFIERNRLLEEVADTILSAISIAYSEGFDTSDIEEMMDLKSLYWLELQNKEEKISNNIPYEIHVTVAHPNNIELYKNDCDDIGVKPIVLDLENSNTVIKDVMTSSKYYGDNRTAYLECERISNELKTRGYDVVRKKIETIPWHPAAPIKFNTMPKNCYFESHIGVLIKTEQDKNLLVEITKKHNAHISRNFFKKLDTGEYVQMLTLRNYNTIYTSFKEDVQMLIDELKNNSFEYEKEIIEFSIYDTKVSHDFNWLNNG